MRYRHFLLLFGCLAGVVQADDEGCRADRHQIERGQARPVLICGDSIPGNFELRGLDDTGLEVTYQQYLRRCGVDDRRPGLYLWLAAGEQANSAAIEVVDADTGQPVCAPVDMRVEPRILLPGTELEPLGDDRWRLRIRVPSGWDLRGVCESTPVFLPDPMAPGIVAVGEPLCQRRSLTMEVRVAGRQRFATSLVLPYARLHDLPMQALVHVSLPEPAWSRSMPASAAKFVEVNGYRTRYFEAGRGADTLILVHGGQPDPLAPTAQSWRANFDALSREFRVLAFDNLGHGYTDPPHTDADYEQYYERAADHLAGLMDALQLSRVHLVGHSQGGWPVLRVALDHPDRVRCVVSAATVLSLSGEFGRPGSRRFAYSLFMMHPKSGPTVESLTRMQRFESWSWNNIHPDWVARDMVTMNRPALAEARERMVKAGMSPGHPHFRALRRQALADMEAGGLREVPHLVLWARQDRLAPVEAGLDFFARSSAGGGLTEMHVIDAAGHRFLIERPEAFNAAIAGFCGRFRKN